MPLSAPKHFTGTGLSGDVTAPPLDQVFGTSTEVPQWTDVGAPRGPVVDFSGITAESGSAFCVVNGEGDSPHLQVTLLFRFLTAPSGAIEVLHVRTSGDGKVSNLLATVSGGAVSVRMRGMGDASLTGWTTGTALTLGTWYMLRLHVTTGTSTVTYAELRTADGDTLLASGNLSSSTATTGSPLLQFGKFSQTAALEWQVDNLAVHDAAAAFIDPAEDLTAPEDEEPGGTEIIHTYVSRTPGEEIGTNEHSQIFGDGSARRYALHNGSVAARFAGEAGLAGFVHDSFAGAPEISFAFDLTIEETPSANVEIFNFRTSSANTSSIVITALNTLRFNTGDGSQNILVAGPLEVGETYEVRISAISHETDGAIRGAVSHKATDLLLNMSETTGLSTGTGNHVAYRFGKITNAPSAAFIIDNTRAVVGGYGWIDPAVEAPWAGPDVTVEPGFDQIELEGRGAGSWSQVSGPSWTWDQADGVLTIEAPPLSFDTEVAVFAFGDDEVTVTVLPCSDGIKLPGEPWKPVVLTTL